MVPLTKNILNRNAGLRDSIIGVLQVSKEPLSVKDIVVMLRKGDYQYYVNEVRVSGIIKKLFKDGIVDHYIKDGTMLCEYRDRTIEDNIRSRAIHEFIVNQYAHDEQTLVWCFTEKKSINVKLLVPKDCVGCEFNFINGGICTPVHTSS